MSLLLLGTPPREQVISAIPPLLEGITGYAYPNPPRVALATNPFVLQHYHPFLAVIQTGGSQLTHLDHDGNEEDLFRFDVYGQIAATVDVSSREWINRLFYDVTTTLRQATRVGGALYALGCYDIPFGSEDVGLNDQYGDFLLPCTAKLRYTLAAW